MTDYYKEAEPYTPPKMYGPRFSAEHLRETRNDLECGLLAARQHLMREQILMDLADARRTNNVAFLFDVLEYMVRERLTPNW